MYGRTHLIQKLDAEPCFQSLFDRARRIDPDPGPKFLIYRVRVRINFVLFRKFTFEVFSVIPIELQQDCTIQNLH